MKLERTRQKSVKKKNLIWIYYVTKAYEHYILSEQKWMNHLSKMQLVYIITLNQ